MSGVDYLLSQKKKIGDWGRFSRWDSAPKGWLEDWLGGEKKKIDTELGKFCHHTTEVRGGCGGGAAEWSRQGDDALGTVGTGHGKGS